MTETDVDQSLDELIAAFAPISLEEMDRVRLMNRVDAKYVVAKGQLASLLRQATDEYRALEVGGVRKAPYKTLYFDSPDHDCFRQHHNGKLNRYKFRMREYATSGACFAEVKKKNNRGRTDKRRMPINEIEETASGAPGEFFESIAPTGRDLLPQLWTWFSRLTLVHRCEAERVTIDWNLRFGLEGKEESMPNLVIVEVKQESDRRCGGIRELLRQLGVRPLRVSKYCLGTMMLKPQLKQNRFKPKLRALAKIAAD